jgi:hypothetical protein
MEAVSCTVLQPMVWGIVIGPTGCTDFVITKLSSTSVLRAQRKKVSTASAPSLTMASPARLAAITGGGTVAANAAVSTGPV